MATVMKTTYSVTWFWCHTVNSQDIKMTYFVTCENYCHMMNSTWSSDFRRHFSYCIYCFNNRSIFCWSELGLYDFR
jgi:hypothetical protein